jgi:hypothetical protein
MKVFISADLPEGMRKHRSYATLIDALRTNDGWVAVTSSDVAGSSKTQKQSAVHSACERAGLRV